MGVAFLQFGKMEAVSTLSELARLHDTLNRQIAELESMNSHACTDPLPLGPALVLARRIAPASVPPTFLRFNSESGPLEAMPGRFRVPFPTMEEFRFSLLNVPNPFAAAPRKAASPVPKPQTMMEDEDEYANDF